MKDVPAPVVYVVSAEAGLIVGLSIIMYFTLRAARTIHTAGRWHDFNKLSGGNYHGRP